MRGIVQEMTFAVVGHDEALSLDRMAELILGAGTAGPRVFVDSASADGSAEVALRCGLEVWPAPVGKGAAVREALTRCDTEWILLLDADVTRSQRNIPDVLARAAVAGARSLGMVVGDFADLDPGSPLSNTWGIYEPLVAALFPEVAGRCGSKPLSGFRALRLDAVDIAAVPDDFALEAWMNIEVAMSPYEIEVVPIGWQEGRFKYKPRMGREIADGVLDQAVRRGRLTPQRRADWDQWAESVIGVVAGYHGEPEERPAFLERLGRARDRPLPSSH